MTRSHSAAGALIPAGGEVATIRSVDAAVVGGAELVPAEGVVGVAAVVVEVGAAGVAFDEPLLLHAVDTTASTATTAR